MLRDDINNAVKDAMRAKDERKLSTLRMVNSTIKNADIAARGRGQAAAQRCRPARRVPENDQAAPGIRRALRQGRPRRTRQAEREEIAIISAYLPKQMSDDDVKAAIAAAIAETGAAGMKDMGKVIAVLKAKYAGQMDFGKASGLVKAALAG